jgi:hypothetical protein
MPYSDWGDFRFRYQTGGRAMSDELSPFARQLAKMYKEQNERELRTHQGLCFVRDDYFRLTSEQRTQKKEDMAAIAAIMERLPVMHLGIGRVVNYDVGDEPGFHLELTPKQWLAAMALWDETETESA